MEKISGLFVFDQQNDIVFTQLDGQIRKKLFEIAKKQELLPDDAVRFHHPHNLSFKLIKIMVFLCVVFIAGTGREQ